MVLTLERGLGDTESHVCFASFILIALLLGFLVPQGTQELVRQVKNLPQANYNLLKYICK